VDPELRALLRRLLLPVYLLTALYTSGAAAIVPVIPLVALRLGMSEPRPRHPFRDASPTAGRSHGACFPGAAHPT
jgi:hypothetical protein